MHQNPFAAFTSDFDPLLAAEVDAAVARCLRMTGDGYARAMLRHLRTLLVSKGKRVRPAIAHLMYRACGGQRTDEAMRFLVALELFHAFALMHDDVIDHGELRHGTVTMHIFARRAAREAGLAGNLARQGADQAVLLGDLVLSWVHRLLGERRGFSEAQHNAARQAFFAMADEVVVGQMLDVAMMSRPSTTRRAIDEKMRLKTASYTFVRPLQIGAALAGAGEESAGFAESFGTSLGLAFQIQDDLLDITAPSSAVQKTVLSDLRDGQHTLLTQHIFEKGTRAQLAALKRLLGKPFARSQESAARRLFADSGAIDAVSAVMRRHFDSAISMLGAFPMGAEAKEEMLRLVRAIRSRTV